jgi:hypothetical protein
MLTTVLVSSNNRARSFFMNTPGFVVLLSTAAMLAATLLVADQLTDQSAAAEVAPISIQQATADKPLSFRDRLVVGLRARLKSEVQFVDFVVMLVHSGQVPQRMVDQTFFWARARAAQPRQGRQRRPIIYFQPGMTVRLRRLGIDV